ncbi:MAG: nickel-dependent hydrogenase large subunit [Actinomycetota bacterium]
MAEIISIDPLTRIEGHLRIDVEVEGGQVVDAWSSGTMFRGIEMLLQDKHPWDAQQVTERICGVCPLVHGTASSYALDDATGVKLPDNARLIRNLTLGANFIQSHVLHFYHLAALDYVDPLAVADYTGSSLPLITLRDKFRRLAAEKDPYFFLPRYESPDYIGQPGGPGDPDLACELMSHYVQALEMRKKAQEALTIFYGRMPSFVGTIPGGVTTRPTIANTTAFKARMQELQQWVDDVYWQDILTVAQVPEYQELLRAGDSGGNYLAYGAFDLDAAGKDKFFPTGLIIGGDVLNARNPGRDEIAKQITESVQHSWYTPECEGLNPREGKTEPELGKKDAYSFLKAPRLGGRPMEVGPLARQLVMQEPGFMSLVDRLGLLTEPLEFGILPRHAARAYEAVLLAAKLPEWTDELQAGIGGDIWDPKGAEIPDESYGKGMVDGPRGALGHWIHIQGKTIGNYQCVVPTTWNASPRDKSGNRGPIESSLVGLPVPDVDNPINVARCVRSFDPCIACAVHVIHPEHNGVKEFRII